MQRRSRLIRPEFFEDEKLADLGDKAMLVLAGLWIIADREGRIVDIPRLIKSFVRPFDADCDFESVLQSLHDSGHIHRYTVNDLKCIQVRDWHKQQSIHHKENQSQLPPPPQLTGLPEARFKQGSSTEEEEEEEVVIEEEAEEGVEPEVRDTEELPWDERNRLRRPEQED
jgi:hypothetical protein